jgi:hypothetical protein
MIQVPQPLRMQLRHLRAAHAHQRRARSRRRPGRATGICGKWYIARLRGPALESLALAAPSKRQQREDNQSEGTGDGADDRRYGHAMRL